MRRQGVEAGHKLPAQWRRGIVAIPLLNLTSVHLFRPLLFNFADELRRQVAEGVTALGSGSNKLANSHLLYLLTSANTGLDPPTSLRRFIASGGIRPSSTY
ncbi:unnamed protein product, partial [Iphiclides podalirius]